MAEADGQIFKRIFLQSEMNANMVRRWFFASFCFVTFYPFRLVVWVVEPCRIIYEGAHFSFEMYK